MYFLANLKLIFFPLSNNNPTIIVNKESAIIDDPFYHDEILRKQMQMLTWYQETCDIVPQKDDQRMQNEFYLRRIAMRDPEKADLIRENMRRSGKNFFETLAEMNKQS